MKAVKKIFAFAPMRKNTAVSVKDMSYEELMEDLRHTRRTLESIQNRLNLSLKNKVANDTVH